MDEHEAAAYKVLARWVSAGIVIIVCGFFTLVERGCKYYNETERIEIKEKMERSIHMAELGWIEVGYDHWVPVNIDSIKVDQPYSSWEADISVEAAENK